MISKYKMGKDETESTEVKTDVLVMHIPIGNIETYPSIFAGIR